jgi:hypothetical protein
VNNFLLQTFLGFTGICATHRRVTFHCSVSIVAPNDKAGKVLVSPSEGEVTHKFVQVGSDRGQKMPSRAKARTIEDALSRLSDEKLTGDFDEIFKLMPVTEDTSCGGGWLSGPLLQK